jgi:hypothetical protein
METKEINSNEVNIFDKEDLGIDLETLYSFLFKLHEELLFSVNMIEKQLPVHNKQQVNICITASITFIKQKLVYIKIIEPEIKILIDNINTGIFKGHIKNYDINLSLSESYQTLKSVLDKRVQFITFYNSLNQLLHKFEKLVDDKFKNGPEVILTAIKSVIFNEVEIIFLFEFTKILESLIYTNYDVTKLKSIK